MKTFTLHYFIEDAGDGSASIHLFKTAKEAEEEEEKQLEEGYQVFCEAIGTLTIRIDDNGELILP